MVFNEYEWLNKKRNDNITIGKRPLPALSVLIFNKKQIIFQLSFFPSNHILPSEGFLTKYLTVYHVPSVAGRVTVIFCSK